MNYYDHHIGDFDRATRHLSRIERSIYRDLIEVYYDTEAQLTLDFDLLCRKVIARTDEERTAVQQTLNEFFTETPTGWYHDRCEDVIDKFRNNTSQKSVAGKASAAKRALKRQQALNGVSTAVEHKSNGTPTNQKPVTKNQKPNLKAKAPQDASRLLTAFELFWQAYPKKVAKGAAEKAFTKITPDVDLIKKIIDAIEAQKGGKAWCDDEGQYIPNPATWLNAKRWLDEVIPYVATAKKSLMAWYATDEGVVEKGLSLDPPIKTLPGEHPIHFKKRVIDAVENGGKAKVVASPPMTVMPPVSTSKPPPGLLQSLAKQTKARTSP